MNYDDENEMFGLAAQLINRTSENVFLTGKAGTGKTTFLKYLKENCPKQLAIVAPTGVAAINAGGVTIHSFFQLPLAPFIPQDTVIAGDDIVTRHGLVRRIRFNRDKIKLLRELELVIIDEISMVRCDTMDAIDTVLRYARKRPYDRFGGVQMLFIGDMFQLPPVIKDFEWKLLSDFYKSPYFFDSAVVKANPPVYIEFEKIYRQSEEKFIRVLNQVRNNLLDDEGMKVLEERFQPGFRRTAGDGYIILTTHNEMARNINNNELEKLPAKRFIFKAEIEGEMPENAWPADENLHLKVGAQVMFLRNDTDERKRYFNGKLAEVTGLEEEKITVKFKNSEDEITVGKEKWENIRYTLNKTSRILEEQNLGSFTQYPLRLAWAITIHKSQGLTFGQAIIDAGEAFASGQVYVALSRCTNLEGMILKSKIRPHSLLIDQRIVEFSNSRIAKSKVADLLEKGKIDYVQQILINAFDLRSSLSIAKDLSAYVIENKVSFNNEIFSWLDELLNQIDRVQQTALKFQTWLKAQFNEGNPSLLNTVKDRVDKAAEHFIEELTLLVESLNKSPAITDSRTHAKEYNESLRELFVELYAKRFFMQGLDEIDPEAWLMRKRSFQLPSFAVNAYAGGQTNRDETTHPALYQKLRKLRDSICLRKDLPIYIVAGSRTLDEMVRYLPQSLSQLRRISGFGDTKIEKYGQQFLDIIIDYCAENNLSSLIDEKLEKRERRNPNPNKLSQSPTQNESFALYRQGKSVEEIAKARNLTTQTIEGHLSAYVATGEINIRELVNPDKITLIEPEIKDYQGGPINPIKEKLGKDITYGEIRLVLAWQMYQNTIKDTIN